jgi:hypothetical protein
LWGGVVKGSNFESSVFPLRPMAEKENCSTNHMLSK